MKNEAQLESYRQPILSFQVNGEPVTLAVPASKRLLSVIRDDLELTGTKRSCEIGRCGACMVLLDGRPVNACLTMAYQCSGKQITTIEGIEGVGIAAEGISEQDIFEQGMHPVQQAFLEEGGYQCGYCTPGMIVTVTALLDDTPNPTQEELEEALSGNLCRCTGYGGIVRAIHRAIEKGRGSL